MVYLSFFHDSDGAQFLGACIVEVPGFDTDGAREITMRALRAAWRQGCNPGEPGSAVKGIVIPVALEESSRPYLNRVLQKVDIDELDRKTVM